MIFAAVEKPPRRSFYEWVKFFFKIQLTTGTNIIPPNQEFMRSCVMITKTELEIPFTLARLRQRRGTSQTILANKLGVVSSNLSRLENEPDPRLSSLSGYVRGLGGELALVAVFRENDGTITKLLIQTPAHRSGSDFFAKRHKIPKAQIPRPQPLRALAEKVRADAE